MKEEQKHSDVKWAAIIILAAAVFYFAVIDKSVTVVARSRPSINTYIRTYEPINKEIEAHAKSKNDLKKSR